MKALVTGASGFLGRNLVVRLSERPGVTVIPFTRASSPQALSDACGQADVVFHVAGVNRPAREEEFTIVNRDLTLALCEAIECTGRKIPVIFSSSTQATYDNPYGASKREAEEVLLRHHAKVGARVSIVRLPNVFGKWSRPNYNSAVATFCHNIARGLPISINDPTAPISLVYVDDVVARFIELAFETTDTYGLHSVEPVYQITVGKLADEILALHEGRTRQRIEAVGTGFLRALYATYMSFVPAAAFSYPIPRHVDPRGEFVEMLKTPESGQMSFFSARPGVTRGGHYHHSKCEKFLVVRGTARMRFNSLLDGQSHEIVVSGEQPQIVDTVPGWAHDITNIGEEDLIVLLWASELYAPERPDTVARLVQ